VQAAHPDTSSPDDGLASSRRIARNAAFRAAGEAVAKLASIAFFIAMARELGQTGFGDFVFAFSLATVLALASGFGTEELVTREVARDREQVHGYLANVVAVSALISVALLLLAALLVNLAGYSADARAAVYIVGAGVAIESLGRTWHAVFTAYERLELISISLVIQRTLTAAVGIAVLMAGGGLIAVSIVFALGCVAGLLISTRVLSRFVVTPRWELDRTRWIPLLRAGVPIGLAGMLFVVLLRVDAALLGFLAPGDDNSEVGVYGAAFRLVEATLFISWAFTTAVLPWIARQEADDHVGRGYELGMKGITLVLMPIGLTFALLASPLIDLLYGSEYADAVLPLRLLGVMTVLYGVNALASTVLIGRDRPQDFSLVAGLVAVENIALNVILMPEYGADAAAFNAALSALLLAVLGIAMVSRHVGRVNLLRAFGAPLAGGAAMAAAVLPLDPPLIPGLAVGGVAYLAGLLAFERLAYPDDLARLRAIAAMSTARRGRART
jgi:O-antigen/teichoic acid export membrane protein